MKRTAIFIWVICFFTVIPSFCPGQTTTIDSLKKQLWAEADPGKKLHLLIDLCKYHQSINKDSLYQYAQLAKKLEFKNDSKFEHSAVMLILINTYLRLGEIDSATVLVDEGLRNNTVKDPVTRSMYFTLDALKVDCLGDASNYKDALSELYTIIDEAEIYHDSLVLSKNMSTLGVINYNLDHVPDAFQWYFKGLSFINNDTKFYSSAIVLYINLAETYRWVQQTDSASYYIDKAIPLCQQTENLFFLANALRIKANIYKEKKEYTEAEKTMLECIAIREKTEGKLTMSNEQLAVAGIYMRSGNTDKAIKLITDGLLLNNAKDNEADPMRISYYQTLAKCYQLKGDNKNYEQTLERIITAKDAFYQANSAHAIAELQTKYEVQKKESTIIKQKLAITEKNYWLFGSALVALLASIIVWLGFKNYRRKQQIKMQVALTEEKRIAAQSIIDAEEHERKRIASDLHDNIGAYASAIRADIEKITDSGFEKNNRSLQNLQQHSQEIINSLRDTIWVLNKDNITITGISDRIKNYISKLQPTYAHIQFHINEEINMDVHISSKYALNIFRIIQEAIHNALKHSEANNISIRIISNETIFIQIEDDGKGIEKNNSTDGNGLLNMEARAKEIGMRFLITSKGNEGTILSLETSNTN